MKKAMLLTLGMLLLSSLVFALAILLFHNTQGTENRFAELRLYDRLYDLDSSIQRGFKEIFTRNSGITLILGNDTVTLTETLPHSSNFADETEAFSDYLEETYNIDPAVTISDSALTIIKNELPIYVMPHNILIEHSSFPNGNLEITPTNLNVKNYSISLTTTKQTVVFSQAITSGSFPLRVSVKTNSGTSIQEYNINPASTNIITLTFDTGLPTQATITITLDDPAQLIINRGSVTAVHNIEIALQHQTENMNYITYPNNLFTIKLAGNNLQKTSTARIA